MIKNHISTICSSHDEEEDLFSFAMSISSAAVTPMILSVVMELGILEIIKSKVGIDNLMSPAEIAAELPTTNPVAASLLDRLLRLLASHGILKCSFRHVEGRLTERMYGLAPVCKFLTADKDGESLHGLIQMQRSQFASFDWSLLKDAILDGGVPLNKMLGMNIFEYLDNNPEIQNVYNAGTKSHSAIMMKKLLQMYHGFNGISCLVHIGGNTGAMLNMILSEYPTIKGINFDLPHVIKDAPSYPGMEHIGGDIFMSAPKGDTFFMKWILHEWSDRDCNRILRNCYDALSDNGKIIVFEHVMPEQPEPTSTTRSILHMDVMMWVGTRGRERTEKEFEYMAKRAGFQGFNIACSVYDMKVMEFRKTNM